MSKARLYGMNNAYIPNSKADMRFHKKLYQRGREVAKRDPRDARHSRKERRAMSYRKNGGGIHLNPNNYIGRTLGDLAKGTSYNHGGWTVYLLKSKSDTTGWYIGKDFYIRDLVRRFPDLSGCVVKSANDYYGQYILRVYRPRKKR